MKIYPPRGRTECEGCGRTEPRGLTEEQLKKGHWQLYADVVCEDCGKEHALTNTLPGQRCKRCGGQCL